jgi:hypothetical protein
VAEHAHYLNRGCAGTMRKQLQHPRGRVCQLKTAGRWWMLTWACANINVIGPLQLDQLCSMSQNWRDVILYPVLSVAIAVNQFASRAKGAGHLVVWKATPQWWHR